MNCDKAIQQDKQSYIYTLIAYTPSHLPGFQTTKWDNVLHLRDGSQVVIQISVFPSEIVQKKRQEVVNGVSFVAFSKCVKVNCVFGESKCEPLRTLLTN